MSEDETMTEADAVVEPTPVEGSADETAAERAESSVTE
jgi:hypothetical protein